MATTKTITKTEKKTLRKTSAGTIYHLVDVSAFVFRAFHTIPMRVRRRDGVATNAIYGFSSMLMKLLEDFPITHLGLVMDAPGPNFRHALYPDYKANRPPPPPELKEQWPIVRDVAQVFGFPALEMQGWEADDLMAAYADKITQEGGQVILISSDKDLMQLVGDQVTMFDPIKERLIDHEGVIEKFGVPPALVPDVQALAGDSTDNIPGVRGIGIKTAAQLIGQFGNLETLLAQAGTISQPKRRESLIEEADMARLSRKLVELDKQTPLPAPLEDLAVRPIDASRVIDFFTAQEFPSLVNRARRRYQIEGGAPDSAPSASRTPAPNTEPPAAPEGAEQDEVAVITNAKELTAWQAFVHKTGRVAMVILADNLRPHGGSVPVGIALATGAGGEIGEGRHQVCYLPCTTEVGTTGDLLDPPGAGGACDGWDVTALIKELQPLWEDAAVLKIGFDCKDLVGVLQDWGVTLTPSADVMLMAYALEGGGDKLPALAQRYLAAELPDFTDLIGSGRTKVTLPEVDRAQAAAYAGGQARALVGLHDALLPQLVRTGVLRIYEGVDRPLIAVTAAMEAEGIMVDPAILQRLSKDFHKRMEIHEAKIHKLAGHDFNVGSPKQLGEVLFNEQGLPGGKKNKSGGFNTSSSVLEPLAAAGVEIADHVLAWRHVAKLKSTYADTLGQDIHPKTGRIHTTYSLAATATGRLSSNHPNLQNIPIRTADGLAIREAFIAPKGRVFVCVDYSQIELRLAAHMTGAKLLIQAFKDGQDIHTLTAQEVLGASDAESRRRAKAINFGIIYGISGFGLGQQLGIDQHEARRFIEAYLDRLPELKAWMVTTKQTAHEQGYVETLMGRRCKITALKEPRQRQFAERQAINAPIQGTAADLIRLAMVRVARRLPDVSAKARLLLQVHDELVIEAPEAHAEKVGAATKAIMEDVLRLDVPIIAVANTGVNWAQAH